MLAFGCNRSHSVGPSGGSFASYFAPFRLTDFVLALPAPESGLLSVDLPGMIAIRCQQADIFLLLDGGTIPDSARNKVLKLVDIRNPQKKC